MRCQGKGAQWVRSGCAESRGSETQRAHRGIVPTSAGVMPPLAKPETIRQVCEWVKAYPVRV